MFTYSWQLWQLFDRLIAYSASILVIAFTVYFIAADVLKAAKAKKQSQVK